MAVVVLTTIPAKEGSIDDVARIFKETNRALVEGHPEWRGAWFTANRQRSEITNVAHWESAEAYERHHASDQFKQTMAQFAELFVGPPTPLSGNVHTFPSETAGPASRVEPASPPDGGHRTLVSPSHMTVTVPPCPVLSMRSLTATAPHDGDRTVSSVPKNLPPRTTRHERFLRLVWCLVA